MISSKKLAGIGKRVCENELDPEERNFWKVTNEEGASCLAKGKAEVVYSSEWTHAPAWLARHGYHLCVFDDQRYAYQFAVANNQYGTWKIWHCEVRGEVDMPVTRYSLGSIPTGEVNPAIAYVGWPTGTRMYREVRLLTCVWETPVGGQDEHLEE